MSIIKNLISGKFSLALTFWGFGLFGYLLIGQLGVAGIRFGFLSLFLVSMLLKLMLAIMVLCGIVSIMRNGRITFFGVIAFIIVLLEVLTGIILAGSYVPLLLEGGI